MLSLNKNIKNIVNYILENSTVFVKIAHRATTPDLKIETQIRTLNSANSSIPVNLVPNSSFNFKADEKVLILNARQLKSTIENSPDPLERHIAANAYEQVINKLNSNLDQGSNTEEPTIMPKAQQAVTENSVSFISPSQLHKRIDLDQEKKFQAVRNPNMPSFAPSNLKNFDFDEKEPMNSGKYLGNLNIFESKVVSKDTGLLKDNVDLSH